MSDDRPQGGSYLALKERAEKAEAELAKVKARENNKLSVALERIVQLFKPAVQYRELLAYVNKLECEIIYTQEKGLVCFTCPKCDWRHLGRGRVGDDAVCPQCEALARALPGTSDR